ncbi:MAG: hypothetical protein ACREJ3_11205 [Polyangiaceae bacterium]
MRARLTLTVGAALAIGMAVALAACIDLFHSTSDIVTACEADASNPICRRRPVRQSVIDAGSNFCSWTPPEARQHAAHVCAWLGACQPPAGGNAFGACMVQALLAFDCASNPNHRAAGPSLARWECLLAAKTCADIDACDSPPSGNPGDSAAISCDAGNDDGGCPGVDAGAGCTLSGCAGSALHWCADDGEGGPPLDVGIDCDGNGDRRCDIFPSRDAGQWAACVASNDATSAACAPDASATCSGGIATSCPSGVVETIDCNTLLGQDAACAAGPLAPPFDWTSPCIVIPSLCAGDACDDGGVTSCARGATFSVNCAQEGLLPCEIGGADAGGPPHAACSPP